MTEITSGVYSTSGDGTSTTFSFAHGCTTGIPAVVISDNALHTNKTGGPVAFCNTADEANVWVVFATPPASGTSLVWNWVAVVN